VQDVKTSKAPRFVTVDRRVAGSTCRVCGRSECRPQTTTPWLKKGGEVGKKLQFSHTQLQITNRWDVDTQNLNFV